MVGAVALVLCVAAGIVGYLVLSTMRQPAADQGAQAGGNDSAGTGSQPLPAPTPEVPDTAVPREDPPAGYKECQADVWANEVTSCSFALRVAEAWHFEAGAGVLRDVYSPVTETFYTMECSGASGWIRCRGGKNAAVLIWAPSGATQAP